MFGAVWDRRHIDNIQVRLSRRSMHSPLIDLSQISITEAGGAEGRGSYYSKVGAIRDVMQNRRSKKK